MANIIGAIVTADALHTTPVDLSNVPLEVEEGLVEGAVHNGPVSLRWMVSPTAPISKTSDREGGWAVVVGNVERDDIGARSDAEFILQAVRDRSENISSFGGYYLAVVVMPDGTVKLGTDIFGNFPLFTWQSGRKTFFATSANQFQHLEGFQAAPDPRGVISLLMFGYMAASSTVWKGVARAMPFQSLVVDGDGRLSVVEADRLPSGELLNDASIGDLSERHLESLRPVLPSSSNELCILQSGGLDSRTIAAALSHYGCRIKSALTMGEADDIEMQCARLVSRAMGNPFEAIPVETARFSEYAERHIALEGMSNGCASFSSWQAIPALRQHGVPFANGFFGGTLVGGENLSWGFDKAANDYSFEAILGSLNGYGFAPDILSGLLRPSFVADNVDCLIQELKAFYDSLCEHEFQKVILFESLTRGRTYIGGNLLRYSLGSWPVSPFANKAAVAFSLQLPEKWFEERRFQKEFLIHRFPELARIPLDRNSFRTEPLDASRLQRLSSRIRSRGYRTMQRLTGRDRRNYYRTFDFNHAGWKDIRRRAHPVLSRLEGIVDMDYLRAIVPDPEDNPSYDDPFRAPNGLKSLMGMTILLDKADV